MGNMYFAVLKNNKMKHQLVLPGDTYDCTCAYETHSAVKRPNAVRCKRMRNATDRSKINNGCMQKHTREGGIIFTLSILGWGLGFGK